MYPIDIENHDTTPGIGMKVRILLSWQPSFWTNTDGCLYITMFNNQFQNIKYYSVLVLLLCWIGTLRFVFTSYPDPPPRPTAVPNMYGLWLSGLWRFSVCPTPHPLFLLLGWNSWNLCSLDTKALTPWSLWVLKTWVCFQLEGLRCRRLGLVIFNQLLSHGGSLR